MAGPVTEEDVLSALRQVEDPDLHRDIVSLGFVKEARVNGETVYCVIELTTPACPVKELLKEDATRRLSALPGIKKVDLKMTSQVRSASAPSNQRLLPQVKNIVAVASGKGGVGKSTVSANIALALGQTGARVGLLDADIYGPSIPTILGITQKPVMAGANRVAPVQRYGLKVISTGFFMPANEAVIWRGPMLHKMIQDLLGVVEWGELDYLVIDLPPGTGDVQLSLCQTIPLTGALIVSTPQDVAWNVAQKAIVMFDKLNTPVLGIVENMSYFVCGGCGHREEVFGSGGVRKAAERLEIPYLGAVPLVTEIRTTADEGDPIVHSDPGHPAAVSFVEVAEKLAAQVSIRAIQGETRIVPRKIGPPQGSEILIEWSDGLATTFSPRELRAACPCAACVHEMTGERLVRVESIPQDIRATAINPVGRYALQIVWSDGHSTGIYGHEFLRQLVARRG